MTKKVVRNTKGLMDMLFDEIDLLHEDKTTPQSSRTVQALVSGIIQTARLEMDFTRFVSDTQSGAPGGPQIGATKAIELGSLKVVD